MHRAAILVLLVNGPIAKHIRLNSGFGCLGPDPQRPAGASIGRALRLMQQNLGGALPGIGAMANYGAMRYTNAVVADDQGTYLTVTQTPVFQKHAAKIWSDDEPDAFVKNPPLAAGFFTLPSSRMGERYHASQRVQDCTFYVDWVILRIRHRQAN